MTEDEVTQEFRRTGKDPRFQNERCSHPECDQPTRWVGHSGEGTQESIVRWPLCDEHADLWLEQPELCPAPGSFRNVTGYAGYCEGRPTRLSSDPEIAHIKAMWDGMKTITIRFGEEDEQS